MYSTMQWCGCPCHHLPCSHIPTSRARHCPAAASWVAPRRRSTRLQGLTSPWDCSVEFLLAAGPAEALRPLGAVASGGETARVMMALKAAPASVLANSGHSTEGKLPCDAQMLPSTHCHVQ